MTDQVLDRRVEFDERSRRFTARALLDALPENKRHRGRAWLPGPCLDQRREGACFKGDTLIRMKSGAWSPISTIKTLDEVVTAEGRTGLVTQTMARKHEGDLIRLRISGHNHLRMTSEHPVLTQRGYVTAGDLVVGDLVAMTKHLDESVSELPATLLAEANKAQRRAPSRALVARTAYQDRWGGITETKVSKFPAKLLLDAPFGRLIGLFLAEGGLTDNKVVWTFGLHEEETLVTETLSLLAWIGAEGRIQRRPHAINVVLYGKHWRALFEMLCVKEIATKQLGPLLSCGPSLFLRAVFDGWMAGDGHQRDGERAGVTVSKPLALDMYGIAQGLGLRPTIRTGQQSLNPGVLSRRPYWEVSVRDGSKTRSPNGYGGSLPDQDAAAVWRRLRAIDRESFSGWVYNIEVDGDHSYVAEGVGVHNCVGFGIAHRLNGLPAPRNLTEDDARTIYRLALTLDQWPGEADTGTSVLAGMKAARQLGYISAYHWIGAGSQRVIDDAVEAVLDVGPVVLGIPWLDSMHTPRLSGLLDCSGRVSGGHCIALVGIRRKFIESIGEPLIEVGVLQQSWGLGYGVGLYGQRGGFCFIRLDDLERLLNNQGEGCVPIEVELGYGP